MARDSRLLFDLKELVNEDKVVCRHSKYQKHIDRIREKFILEPSILDVHCRSVQSTTIDQEMQSDPEIVV